MQYDIQDRRKVYALLQNEGIEIPRYAVLDRDSSSSSMLLLHTFYFRQFIFFGTKFYL